VPTLVQHDTAQSVTVMHASARATARDGIVLLEPRARPRDSREGAACVVRDIIATVWSRWLAALSLTVALGCSNGGGSSNEATCDACLDAPVVVPAFQAVWGADASHVWAVGDGGMILAFDGVTWKPQTSGTTAVLTGVYGADATHVWAVGAGGTILFFDGASWRVQMSGSTARLDAVWAGSPTDAWAVGDTALHWDGTTWRTTADGLSGATSHLSSVRAVAANDVWAGSDARHNSFYRWNGKTWVSQNSGEYGVEGIWGTRANDFWGVGDNAFYWHFTGGAFPDYIQMNFVSYNPTLLAVWGNATDGTIWTVGERGAIASWDGTRWTPSPSPTTHHLEGVWSSGPSDAWAVGEGKTIVHWDGSRWTNVM
jgi:hypothetical protein